MLTMSCAACTMLAAKDVSQIVKSEIKLFNNFDKCGTYNFFKYSRSSRKRPPREFKRVVATRDGRLREWALVSDKIINNKGWSLMRAFSKSLWNF